MDDNQLLTKRRYGPSRDAASRKPTSTASPLSLFAVIVLASCASLREDPRALPDTAQLRSNRIVVASYYGQGDGLHGKRTASGEVFDAQGLTAAHKTYPFGTILRVTNPDNRRWVNVRVNDRGPFRKGRDIDLSVKAAQILGIDHTGTAKVVVERVGMAGE